jgi:hypothetical protein
MQAFITTESIKKEEVNKLSKLEQIKEAKEENEKNFIAKNSILRPSILMKRDSTVKSEEKLEKRGSMIIREQTLLPEIKKEPEKKIDIKNTKTRPKSVSANLKKPIKRPNI